MKTLRYIMEAILALSLLAACNEKEFLTEVPYSIYSPENALVSESDYQAMVNHLYFQMKRCCLNIANQSATGVLRSGDYGYNSNKLTVSNGVYTATEWNDLNSYYVPEQAAFGLIWKHTWDLISNANVVITRVKTADINESAKNKFLGEALFARSWAYNYLANLFGGMPILDGEISAPSRAYTRDTRAATWQFALDGFTQAASLLPDIDKAGDGKLNKQICQHYIAETNISLGNYDAAITAATSVINYSGVGLMKQRFGTLKDKPGDVYWDLFRMGNYNYSCGNHEGLFVYQCDYKNAASLYDNKGDYDYLVRDYNCRYIAWNVTLDNFSGALMDTKPVSDYCGRAYGYIHPTDHFLTEIWEGMDGDIRNSQYNIMRDIRVNNKKATGYYGKWLIADGVLAEAVSHGYDTNLMYWWPMITKVANTSYDWPELEKSSSSPVEIGGWYAQTSSGRDHSHKDSYMARLAETYLLRAEAYVKNGQAAKAADDINVLRDRAGAPHVTGTVDIDYVLDERMRELYAEENRTVTLMRMGKFVDRVKRYNWVFMLNGINETAHNLCPIPYSEIENNALADLEQNPGY